MSDTPITDAAEEEARCYGALGYVRADLCRFYERELAATKAQLQHERAVAALLYSEAIA